MPFEFVVDAHYPTICKTEFWVVAHYNDYLYVFEKFDGNSYSFHIPTKTWKRLSVNVKGIGILHEDSIWFLSHGKAIQLNLQTHETISFSGSGKIGFYSAIFIYNNTIYGCGHGIEFYNLVTFDLNTKNIGKFTTKQPAPSMLHSHSCNVYKDAMYMFGGYPQNCEMHKLNLLTREWSLVQQKGDIPTSRWGHSCLNHGDKMYLFGGHGNGFRQDFYQFDFNNETWTKLITVNPPSSRYYHGAVIVGCDMYIFGGGINVKDNLVFKVRLPSLEKNLISTSYFSNLIAKKAFIDLIINFN